MKYLVIALALTACSPAMLGKAIKTASDIWQVINKTREFVEPLVTKERIQRVDKVVANKDMPGALRELTLLLRELREQGHDVPTHITEDMLFSYQAIGGMVEGLQHVSLPTPEMKACAEDEDCA